MSQELKEPDEIIELRKIQRQLRIEAGNDMFKYGENTRKWAKENGIVYSKRSPINSPGIRKMLAEGDARRAKRREKIDAYLAKRAARTAHAKSA